MSVALDGLPWCLSHCGGLIHGGLIHGDPFFPSENHPFSLRKRAHIHAMDVKIHISGMDFWNPRWIFTSMAWIFFLREKEGHFWTWMLKSMPPVLTLPSFSLRMSLPHRNDPLFPSEKNPFQKSTAFSLRKKIYRFFPQKKHPRWIFTSMAWMRKSIVDVKNIYGFSHPWHGCALFLREKG